MAVIHVKYICRNFNLHKFCTNLYVLIPNYFDKERGQNSDKIDFLIQPKNLNL